MIAIGAVFGAVTTLAWSAGPSSRVVEGVVGAIDDTGSAIQLSEPAEESDVGYGIVGIQWRDAADGGPWQRQVAEDGFPTCLDPADVDRPVRLGLVTDPGGTDRPPSEVVAWLECL